MRLQKTVLLAALLAWMNACAPPPQGTESPRASDQQDRGKSAEAAEAADVSHVEARDVILITLDTLRADALELGGTAVTPSPWLTPAPNLEQLAREGRTYSFALAHNTITLPSHTNILTGLYPYQHGVRENAEFTLREELPTAASLFATEGFATGAFVSAYVLDSRFGLAKGFETYDDEIERAFEPSAVRIWERRGPQTVSAALEWWQSNAERRRFLWLHLFEPHLPYAPPAPFSQDFIEPYRGEVAALDSFLGDLLTTARTGAHSPLIVITADHGESLGDHGEPAHGIFAYQSTLAVPLLVWGPGVAPGTDDRLARHVDILPTLLHAANVEKPRVNLPGGFPGSSLLEPPKAELSSYFECLSATFDSGWAPLRGLVKERLKIIDLPQPELYDLVADPGEQLNLVEVRRRDFHRLKALLPEESAWPPQRGSLSDEAAARLRSLGYLGDSSSTVATSFTADDDPKKWIHLEQLKQSYAEHLRAGRFQQAIDAARSVLAEKPTMSLAHLMLAEAQAAAGLDAESMATMRAAWRSKAASPALLRKLARTLTATGAVGEALSVLAAVAEGGDAETRGLYGHLLRLNGKPREAKNVLLAVARAVPDDALVWERLSAVSLDLGQPQDARSQAQRALELDETLPQSWNNLGVALVMMDRFDDGFSAWQRALDADPELWDTLYNLGFQAAGRGRRELAISALERFIAQAPASRYRQDLEKAKALLRRIQAN